MLSLPLTPKFQECQHQVCFCLLVSSAYTDWANSEHANKKIENNLKQLKSIIYHSMYFSLIDSEKRSYTVL